MTSQAVLLIPRVEAPELDQPFLTHEQWATIPAHRLVRAEDGNTAAMPTDMRIAWSARGVHLCFCCTDTMPLSRDFAEETPITDEEVVGVFLDPVGERSQYMAILVSPYGRVVDARIENSRHHGLQSEADESWNCPGIRVRCWSGRNKWSVEMLIPFDGITPAIDTPHLCDRWTGNFYRLEHQPILEVSSWQPLLSSPPNLHDSERFGILEFA